MATLKANGQAGVPNLDPAMLSCSLLFAKISILRGFGANPQQEAAGHFISCWTVPYRSMLQRQSFIALPLSLLEDFRPCGPLRGPFLRYRLVTA
jgi:hypothetical protein